MTSIGVALLPDGQYLDRFVQFQNVASDRFGLTPRLDSVTRLPHLSLLQLTQEDGFNVGEVVRDVAKTLLGRTLSVRTSGIDPHPPNWVFVTAERSDRLVDLQAVSIASAQAHGARFARRELERSDNLTAEEWESWMTYGYRFVGPAFLPHITLGRRERALSDDELTDLRLLATDYLHRPSFSVAGVSAFIVGPDGERQEPIRDVWLDRAD